MGLRDIWDRFLGRSPQSGGTELPQPDRSRLIRRRIYFSGEVQGVGFRYRCLIHARELGVTGFAQNLLDGRVRAEFQSDEEHIQAMIEALKKEPWIEITDMQVTERPVDPAEQDFTVDYF